MAAWAGFSEDDLQRLQTQDKTAAQDGSMSMQSGKKRAQNMSKPRPQRAVQPMKHQLGSPDSSPTVDLPPSARLSQPAKVVQTSKQTSQKVDMKSPQSVEESAGSPLASSEPVLTEPGLSSPVVSEPHPSPPAERESKELLSENDGRNRELSNLEQYQQEQKRMEEMNKKKKELLAKTLAQRQKQANVEAHKLTAIKKELSHLDQRLTVDVNVIRNRIEEATKEYAEASKRYELAEKEFIASKINLHKSSEMKEQLTEHLYTIIHQNESRKAQKLTELLDKLDLATEEAMSDPSLLNLPSCSLLGNVQTVGSGNLVKRTTSSENTSTSPADSGTGSLTAGDSSGGTEGATTDNVEPKSNPNTTDNATATSGSDNTSTHAEAATEKSSSASTDAEAANED